jgi:murein endopeptidase
MRRAVSFILMIMLLAACAPANIPPGATGSVGRPSNGVLVDGVQLQPSDELIVLDPDHAWGDKTLVDLLHMAALEMRKTYPDTVPLVVGDLSARDGGPLPPHQSHQSGRDADVAMYPLDNELHRPFLRADEDNLDVEKTWYLIETLLHTGLVKYILLDWNVQIYDEVQITVPQQTLDEVFQYPRPRGTRKGIIRHAAGHANHMHVRIHCPDEDIGCVEE